MSMMLPGSEPVILEAQIQEAHEGLQGPGMGVRIQPAPPQSIAPPPRDHLPPAIHSKNTLSLCVQQDRLLFFYVMTFLTGRE